MADVLRHDEGLDPEFGMDVAAHLLQAQENNLDRLRRDTSLAGAMQDVLDYSGLSKRVKLRDDTRRSILGLSESDQSDSYHAAYDLLEREGVL